MRIIIVGAKNESKVSAIKKYFPFEIIAPKHTKHQVATIMPTNINILKTSFDKTNSVHFNKNDIIIAIEGGLIRLDNKYFMTDVCCLKDKLGYRFGFGNFYEISKSMYICAKKGFSLGDIVKAIDRSSVGGVINYITEGHYNRKSSIERSVGEAIMASYVNDYNLTNKTKIKRVLLSECKNFKKLDFACKDLLSKTKE